MIQTALCTSITRYSSKVYGNSLVCDTTADDEKERAIRHDVEHQIVRTGIGLADADAFRLLQSLLCFRSDDEITSSIV